MARTSGGLVLAMVADTGGGGFALQNGTPTILSWTAPNDGNLHSVILTASIIVTSAETGGAVGAKLTLSNGTSGGEQIEPPNLGPGLYVNRMANVAVPAGATYALYQSSSLTAGAATLYAQIWAA